MKISRRTLWPPEYRVSAAVLWQKTTLTSTIRPTTWSKCMAMRSFQRDQLALGLDLSAQGVSLSPQGWGGCRLLGLCLRSHLNRSILLHNLEHTHHWVMYSLVSDVFSFTSTVLQARFWFVFTHVWLIFHLIHCETYILICSMPHTFI